MAMKAMMAAPPSSGAGMRAALLEGLPGCGKTAFTKAFADEWEAEYIYSLLHSWTDDQELFVGVDIASTVAGDVDNIRQPGVLARAAELSHRGRTVVALDELDKVQERTEYLLLDFLQTGRVPVSPGRHLQARLENLVVFATSNGERPLSDATLRRFRRVRMRPLTRDLIVEIVTTATGASVAVVRLAAKVASQEISLQEIKNFCIDISMAASMEDVVMLANQWLVRDGALTAKQLSPLWGELCSARRRIR